MSQTHKQSLVEAIFSTLFALALTTIIQPVAIKLFTHVTITYAESLSLAVFFTLVSFIRNYGVRRVFNRLT